MAEIFLTPINLASRKHLTAENIPAVKPQPVGVKCISDIFF